MNKFNTSFKGYDKTEVDKFIDEVTMRYSNLLNALKVKEQELKETKEKLDYFDNLVDSLNKAMMAAEDLQILKKWPGKRVIKSFKQLKIMLLGL